MKNKILTLIVGISMLFVGCTEDFEDLNTNPNNPEIAPATNVFAYAIRTLSGRFGRVEMTNPSVYVGHLSNHNYVDAVRYSSPADPDHWDYMFVNILSNINYVIEKSEEESNVNLQAAAMVLKAYVVQMLVDTYGPVPYSESGLGADNTSPAFDSEDVIYRDLLEQLKTANGMFDANSGEIMGVGDLLYGGDPLQWKKLCNSLRLRIAIRMSNVDEATAKSHIAEIFNDPTNYPVIASNDDNAQLKYPGGEWVEPWTSQHNSIGDDRIAKPIVDKLKELSDPRLYQYAEPTSDGDYIGLAVGDKTQGNESKVHSQFVANEAGYVYFLKYSEVELIRAEAAARGFISSSAKDAYESGIRASMQEFGITDDEINSYIASSKVAWDGDVKKVYTQKWIALFRNGWEAWAEMRRTDVPTLAPAIESTKTGHNRPPFRFSYPIHEKNLNGGNIPGNVNEVDIFWGYKVWWDTRSGVQ